MKTKQIYKTKQNLKQRMFWTASLLASTNRRKTSEARQQISTNNP